MPHAADTSCPPPSLVDLVDFKWLMLGEGHRIDVERLRTDAHYAGNCLSLAAASATSMLREAGQRIGRTLQVGLPLDS